MHPGMFIGFTWSIGDPMTFKVLQCNKYLHKRNIVVHRGVIVPRSLTATGYNSALAPNSDTYFPVIQVEGGDPRKNVQLEHQIPVYPPRYFHSGGRRKAAKAFDLASNWF